MAVDDGQLGQVHAVPPAMTGFRHEVFSYADDATFLAGLVPFLTEGVERDESVVVVESPAKIEMLAGALGSRAAKVTFADMSRVGRNPARIIPAWQTYLDRANAAGQGFRGVGEPIWYGRSADELDECHRHEALLNTAFADSGDWSLLCPYDTSKLSAETLAEAASHHPLLFQHGSHHHSAKFFEGFDVFGGVLPEPASVKTELEFDSVNVTDVRLAASETATAAGLPSARTSDFALAMHELAVNSLSHGGGTGSARFWEESGMVFGEVRDSGVIDQPLIGRVLPELAAERGRGLWLVQQLCDLVQIRSSRAGSVIRLRIGGR